MWVSFLALSCQACSGSAVRGGGQTDISRTLNGRIAGSSSGTYKGKLNKGVMVRSPDFFDGGDEKVLPATFWHNDIYAPSQMYPTISSPWCPNNGWDGYYNTNSCKNDEGPWNFATVGVVMGNAMTKMWKDFSKIQDDNWGYGVFYASDANAADKRCVYRASNKGWDCPGGWLDYDTGSFTADGHKGSGSYAPGNPDASGGAEYGGGGGTGCHFDSGAIDQPDAYDSNGNNLVQDANCQCNYAYKGEWWKWVDDWTCNTQQKPGYENRNWLDGSGNMAPAWGTDTAACWMNNPRDMIGLQNALFWQRSSWNNQLIPQSDWGAQSSEELRKYWGWNEVPVAKSIVNDAKEWDAIIIKLPADACNDGNWGLSDDPSCLSSAATHQLEADLDQFVNSGKLVPGSGNTGLRPGSYVLFVREYGTTYGTSGTTEFIVNWSRHFFCSNWVSPNNKWQVVYAKSANGNTACYIEHAVSQESPKTTPKPPSQPSQPSQPSPPSPPPPPPTKSDVLV